MATDYLELLQTERKANAESGGNPYLDMLEGEANQRVAAFRSSASLSVDDNPDEVARQRRVAKLLGRPLAAVQSLPQESERAAKIKAMEQASVNAPVLRRAFTDTDFAKLAHDNVDSLSGIEAAISGLGSAAKYLVSHPDRKNTLLGDVVAGVYRASRGAAGVFQAAAELPAPLLDFMEPKDSGVSAGWRGAVGGNPLRRLAGGFAAIGAENEAKAKALSPAQDGAVAGGISSGVQSLTQNLLMLPMAFLPGGPGAALGGMVGSTGGQAYQDARTQGLPMSQALPFAASQAAIEYATEKLPLSRLLGDISTGASLKNVLMNQVKSEVPGEQIATILQDLNEWAVLPQNKDKTFSDYLADRPGAAAQTLIATLVGVGGNVAVMRTIDSAIASAEARSQRAQGAQQQAELLARLNQLTTADKVLQRDPETFQQFVAQAAEAGPVQQVFIDAQTLMQSGVAEQVAAVSPAVASQLDEALQTGGQIAIPVDEYATRIAPTEYAQSLLDHLRTDPEGFSRAEAQAYTQNHADELRSEVERTLTEKQGDDVFKQSAEAVRSNVKDQLDAAARFTSQVNDVYAAMVGNFYAVQAAKLGTTPEEMFARYPLTIGAESIDGQQFDQSTGPFGPMLTEFKGDAQGAIAKLMEMKSGEAIGALHHPDIGDIDLVWGEEGTGASDGYGLAKLVKYHPEVLNDLQSVLTEMKVVSRSENRINLESDDHRAGVRLTWDNQAKHWLMTAFKKAERSGDTTRTDTDALAGEDDTASPTDASDRIVGQKIDQFYQSETAIKTDLQTSEVERTYGGRQAYDQAKAAGQTKLAYSQWLQVRTPNFKAWFGDWENDPVHASKALDPETGEPLVVYHGTGSGGFTIFDRSKWKTAYGHFFTPDKSAAAYYEGGGNSHQTYELYLRAKNPLRFDSIISGEEVAMDWLHEWVSQAFDSENGDVFDQFYEWAASGNLYGASKGGLQDDLIATAEANGHDAFVFADAKGGGGFADSWVVFASEQIKSATNNNGGFNSSDPNILHQSAYHGSPHRFDKFTTDKMGMGAGAQAYGWGLYFASKKEVAEFYRSNLTVGRGHSTAQRTKPDGQLYKVEIPEDNEMLLWDKPLREQPELVKNALLELSREDVRTAEDFDIYSTAKKNTMGDDAGFYYTGISKALGGAKNASDALSAHGIKGIKYIDGTSRASGDGSYNYVIFSEDDVQITNQFYQAEGVNRGAFNPATSTITLLKGADLSTFLHESGHFFLEVTADMAAQPDAPAQVQHDMNALLQWFGVDSLAEWHNLDFEQKRAYHEKFARGFEAYLFEGKAPSIEMQGLFQRFRAWLLNVYRDLKNLNVELTPEVRGVFDRMLATNEQIQLAEHGRSMMPMFATAEQAGMTPEEFASYQALGVDATNDAIQNLQAKGLRDMQWLHNARGRIIKQLQKEAAAQRAEVRIGVRAEVMSQPIYQAWQFLTGKQIEGGEPVGKLPRTALAEMYGVGEGAKIDKYALLDWKRLTDLRMTSNEGIHPDIVAERFGFSSGDELVRRLLAAEKPDVEIDALTDLRMLEQFGELSSQEAIEKAADKAIHNDARARFVATEANALAKATGQRKVLASAATEYAAAMISRLKVRDIRPVQYASGEVRAAKAAEKASKSGDLATAAAEKRNQLIQNYATRAAYDAQEEVDKGLRYLKKFEGDIKGLDADYAEQIGNLLERFDLRKGQSNKAIDKRTALSDWIKTQRDSGLEPDIPPKLENEAFRTSYKDLTVEEFRGLIDSVRQIEHLGRLKHKLLTASDQRAYEAVRDEIAASIHQHAQGREADTRTPTTNTGRAVHGLKRFWAAHIKAATWARILDGGKDGGPVWEYLVRSANTRGDQETTMRAEATAKLSEILAPVFKLGKMGGKGQFFPSIGRSLNREARLAIAMNMGNDGNIQRLLGGEGWTPQQIAPVLQSLTAQEWQAVQAVWDHFESYRTQIAAKERRVYGKEPTWVEPLPFAVTAQDGTTVQMRGGYYPIKYDPAASQRAEEHTDAEGAKRQLQGAYTTATTRRSFTKSRAEEVSGRPLLYTLSGLYSGVNDVIHDLAWHEWLIDVNRLLRSHTIDQAIREHYGPEVKQQFKTWAADIAEGEKGADAAVDLALSRLRQGISASGLGFNVMSAMMQPLGITQSITRVGAQWVGRGVLKYLSGPIGLTRQVNEMSGLMANRSRTRFRELNELRNQVQDQSAFKEMIGRYAYFLMMRCQQIVDVPTWWGAYEKAISEGNDESRAVSLADQAVTDAQGGGQTKDLSAIERGGPAQKLFTVFYSFMNTALNIGVEKTMSADTPAKRAKLAVDYAMLYVVPAVLGYFLKAALTPGDADDDDPEKLAKKLLANQIDYLMGLMVVVREFGEAAKTVTGSNDMGRDYTGPAGLRLVADAGSLAKQAHQGEFDDAFRKAAVNVVGDLFGLPSAQTNRTITGAQALADGKTENPAAVVFGFQEKR